jgi:cytochrome c2
MKQVILATMSPDRTGVARAGMKTRWLSRLGFVTVLLTLLPFVLSRADDGDGDAAVKFSPEAAATFNKRCTACHTYGKGVKVGPDLKGVNERRKQEWLLKFIHASSKVIGAGDPTATALFAQFKQQRMPDWIDLSDQQIKDILDYIKIGGPDIKPADERNAQLATAEEVENGRKLFYGEIHFKYGALACVTCHGTQGGGLRGGSLGPDLTGVYMRYQDMALTAYLRHPCLSVAKDAPSQRYLTAREGFAVKAFLYMMASQQRESARNTVSQDPGDTRTDLSDPAPARSQR